jgi:2-polyprenyl-6-methoxyphenol hydroxylase-like FAD-dependent oxidoreductase
VSRTACVVVGGGPAGMVLGLLLARASINVTVLEKHADFLRDFRGDTVHASTLTLLDELGLGEAFSKLPHRLVDQLQLPLASGPVTFVGLRHLPGPHKHIAIVPQWDFLDLLADAARTEPTFTLRMNTEVTGLLHENGAVVGVRYRDAEGSTGVLRADLTIACDGRTSTVRAASGLRVREFGVPLDVWWLRIPRRPGDPEGANVRFGHDAMLFLIDRGDHFQAGYLIIKGSDAQLRAHGLEAFRKRLATLMPALADRVDTVRSWQEVKLLTVRLNRMPRWYAAGLLCIGDAAHAMSPVGGVGINLAVQDAVAAARYLAAPLRRGETRVRDLARVQRRRWLPTVVTQSLQWLIHQTLLKRVLAGEIDLGESSKPPAPLRLFQRFSRLHVIPAYVMAIGVLPEHAPSFARRPSAASPTRPGG